MMSKLLNSSRLGFVSDAPARQALQRNERSSLRRCRDIGWFRPLPLALAAHPEEHSSTGGDREVQEELIKMLRVGVSREQSKERLREDVREIVQEEAERLKRATEDAKKEVDRLQQLMQDRSRLEFGSALADINQSADEFEDQLKKSRAEMESKQAEFQEWEQRVMRDKSMGQFFQSLYGSDKGSKTRRGRSRLPQPPPGNFDRMGWPTTKAAMRDVAASEVRSPTRMYIFMFMSLNLSALCFADLLSGTPALISDLVYVLMAFALGASALSERQHFVSQASGRDSDRN